MATNSLVVHSDTYENAESKYLRRQIEEDVKDLDAYLREIGMGGWADPDQSNGLPERFIVGLAVVLRLRRWEDRGIHIHLDIGLFSGDLFLKILVALGLHDDPEADLFVAVIFAYVFDIMMNRFAWEGSTILGADIVVGDVEEDLLIKAVARFAWEHRHILGVNYESDNTKNN